MRATRFTRYTRNVTALRRKSLKDKNKYINHRIFKPRVNWFHGETNTLYSGTLLVGFLLDGDAEISELSLVLLITSVFSDGSDLPLDSSILDSSIRGSVLKSFDVKEIKSSA